jgi:excisionase family DNA binding protein
MNSVIAPARFTLPAAQSHCPEVLLVDPTGAAAMLGISKRHLEDLTAEGGLPAPVKLGRSVRYSVETLRQWVKDGCPSRSEWETNRKSAEAASP